MEICNQLIKHLELISGINKDFGIVISRNHFTGLISSTFYGTAACGSDTDYLSTCFLCAVNDICCLSCHLIKFRMHMMVENIVFLDRSESPQSHMKRDIGNLYALFLDLFQKLLCKVESCCRRCRRTFILGIHSLITVLILQFMCNIRRQWHLTKLVKHFLKDSIIGKLNEPVSLVNDIDDFACQETISKADHCALPGLFARFHKCLPNIIFTPLEQEHLNGCSCLCLCSHKPCRNDLCIV